MDMIFDTATGQLSIDHTEINHWGADLRAMLTRNGQTVNLNGVKMSLTISADGVEIFNLHLPPSGVKYKQTDQDILATGRVMWEPDQTISVSAWCQTTSGQELTATAEFVAPRPESPFPSWVWNGNEWEAPLPYPDDGAEYVWDESLGEWVEAST